MCTVVTVAQLMYHRWRGSDGLLGIGSLLEQKSSKINQTQLAFSRHVVGHRRFGDGGRYVVVTDCGDFHPVVKRAGGGAVRYHVRRNILANRNFPPLFPLCCR